MIINSKKVLVGLAFCSLLSACDTEPTDPCAEGYRLETALAKRKSQDELNNAKTSDERSAVNENYKQALANLDSFNKNCQAQKGQSCPVAEQEALARFLRCIHDGGAAWFSEEEKKTKVVPLQESCGLTGEFPDGVSASCDTSIRAYFGKKSR